jgi:hypothetical protein
MKFLTPILTLLLALAGCMDEPAQNVTSEPDTESPPAIEVSLLELVVNQTIVELRGQPLVLSGTVSGASTITVTGGPQAVSFEQPAAGNWTVGGYMVEFGHTNVTITADDGAGVATTTLVVKRLMRLTVEVNHDPAQGADRSDEIFWDFGGLRSLREDASYQDCAQPHPGRPNAHDALLDYVDVSGVHIEFSECGSFGVSPSNVDNVDYGALEWCFNHNGAQAELGISLLELDDQDILEFVNCSGFA